MPSATIDAESVQTTNHIDNILEQVGQVTLTPPWYTLRNEIAAAIGNAPSVHVGPLNTSQMPYVVPITVDTDPQAVALASILRFQHTMGNVAVQVQVKDANGQLAIPIIPQTPAQLQGLTQTALKNNGWFVQVAVSPVMPGRNVVYPVFTPAVIQFYNDDLSDLYRSYNSVVAAVFSKILQGAPGGIALLPSTDKAKK